MGRPKRFGRWLVEYAVPFGLGWMLGATIVALFFLGVLWGWAG